MNAHTPGPWEAVGALVRTKRGSRGEGGILLAECWLPSAECHENARVMAAAPTLLEALEEVANMDTQTGALCWCSLPYTAPYRGHDGSCEAARAAIALARGAK